MRRDAKILAATLAFAGLWAGAGPAQEALASMQTFKVRQVEVRGVRYLSQEEAVRVLAVDSATSLWADMDPIADRLRAHALVADVRTSRRVPRTLVVTVTERSPVAFVATPTLEPVDAAGVRLPIDPSWATLDLPVLELEEVLPDGATVLPERARRLAAEVGRLQTVDTAFLQGVSEVRWADDATVFVGWTEPRVGFLVRPGVSSGRLGEGIAALSDALARDQDAMPDLVDLRYADQVVVRRSPSHGMNDAR